MISRGEHGAELVERGSKYVNAAGIERGKPSFSTNQMQRCTLACASFSERKSAVVKIKGSESASTIGGLALLAPVQAASDHEMEDQPEIVVETKSNALADAAQAGNFAALNGLNGRICSAEKRWAANVKVFQSMAEHTLLQRFNVNNDVRKFWHGLFLSLQPTGRFWRVKSISLVETQARAPALHNPQKNRLLHQFQLNLLVGSIELADTEAANLTGGRCVRLGSGG